MSLGHAHRDELRAQAHRYADRGFSLLPIVGGNGKEPPKGFGWKRFRQKAAPPKVVDGWFDRFPELPAVAVILGSPSGNLHCRDFDKKASYDIWAKEHPRQAKTFPTAKTYDGYHVYGLGPRDLFLELDDGEYRADPGHYCLLPPSAHPDGGHYKWLIPLPAEGLPTIHPVADGLLTQQEFEAAVTSAEAKRTSKQSDTGVHRNTQDNTATPHNCLCVRI